MPRGSLRVNARTWRPAAVPPE